MPEKLNSFLSRDRRRAYIVIALAELILSAAVFFAVRFVFESLFYYLSYVGKILRVMAADIIAWTVSMTAAYPFYKKYVFGADNDADGEKLSRFLGLSAASSVAEILILLFATCVLSCRGLISKLFGTAFSSLCFLIIGCMTLREDNIPHLPEKIKNALFTNPRQYKKIKSPLLRTLLRTAGYVALAVTPFFCAVMLEMFNYAGITRFTSFLDKHPGSFLLSVTVLYLIFAVLLLILKRGGVAAALMIAVSVAAGIANYLKYSLTGDYFYPWDLVNQSGNIGELLSFVSSGIPAALILLIIVGALIAVTAFASRSDLPVKAYIRIPAAALIVLSMWSAVSTTSKIESFLDGYGVSLFDMALQSSNYSANGFTGAFIVNVLSMNVTEPDGYSEEAVAEILDGYEDDEVSDDYTYPDIIVILSESFWDPTLLPGVEFSYDPLENFREIASRDGTYSGYMYETGLGGGTVRPEFEILTGLTTDYLPSGSIPWQYVTSETPSYVSVYQSLGYRTIALHPYTSSFYSRKSAYPLIGFDELYFEDELYEIDEVEYTTRGGYISDDSFVDYIEYCLEESDGTPTFLFGISMENHQPYKNKFGELTISAESDTLDEDTLALVINYAEGAADADRALAKLVDYIDSRDRDTVLIFFGDHLPTLGSNLSAYVESGMITSASSYTDEDRLRLYRTPFLIYANFELGDTDILSADTDNETASYVLLSAAADLIGAPKTAYMKLLTDYALTIPFYNIRLNLTVSDDALYYVNAQKMITYDLLVGRRYSLLR